MEIPASEPTPRIETERIKKVPTMPSKRLSMPERQEIFRVLVATQDLGLMSVGQSRQHVTQHFGIADEQLREIEEEGLDKQWPPLDEEPAQTID